ncbi:MAG: tetrahydromethanopterin S-methyltransferase subunit H family protein [Candidatus Thorarchaeota archaeon]
MRPFKAEQQTFEIGGVKIGGQPGTTPTVMIGSMFYRGQKIVTDDKQGRFEKAKAKEIIETQAAMSEKTGLPGMIDLVVSFPEAAKAYIDFASETTDMPLLIDSTSAESRIAAISYAAEIGLTDRIVYNSLMPHHEQAELDTMRDLKIKHAVLLAFDDKLASSSGRIEVIKNEEGTGLYDKALEHGITKMLIDTCVLDIPSLGMASLAIQELKENYGLVCGCGAHNSVATWKGLKKKFKPGLKPLGNAVSGVVSVMAGADFLLYGPIEEADTAFPMVAMTDAALGQLEFERTGKFDMKHPLFRIA